MEEEFAEIAELGKSFFVENFFVDIQITVQITVDVTMGDWLG
ncbi:MAG: hypothetical protein AAFP07_09760 [Cyanobacteria bacterium J06606_4]